MNNRFVFKKVNTPPKEDVNPITMYIKKQVDTLIKLEQVLLEENKALKEREYSRLQPVSHLKSDLMLQLQAIDQKLKLHPQMALLKTEYAKEVADIKNRMKRCQYRNAVNGKLIVMSMQTANKLRSLFVNAKDLITRNMTYNAKGSASARPPERVSVSA